jgi:hypothetical protein
MFIACRDLEFFFCSSRLIYWFLPDAISSPTKTIYILRVGRHISQRYILVGVVEYCSHHTENTRIQSTILGQELL